MGPDICHININQCMIILTNQQIQWGIKFMNDSESPKYWKNVMVRFYLYLNSYFFMCFQHDTKGNEMWTDKISTGERFHLSVKVNI